MLCPHCEYSRFWRLRRNHARCKKCRREWSLNKLIVPEIRANEDRWREVVDLFLRDETVLAVASESKLDKNTIHKMLSYLRLLTRQHLPTDLAGPIEIDDAYLGPRWHNRKWNNKHTKRGRGTDQQPILGLFDRRTERVAAISVPKVQWRYICPIVTKHCQRKVKLYSDTYSAYHPAKRNGFRHYVVDHVHGEYARGEISVNQIESFWGYVKRRFKTTGGLRRERIDFYLTGVGVGTIENFHEKKKPIYSCSF